jgi:transposase
MGKEPPSNGEWNAFYSRLMRLFKMYRERGDEAGALAGHLMRELDSLWTFLHEPDVAATDNHAERPLRFPVIWRKRGFGTRTGQGEEFVERPLSLRRTCRLRRKRTYPCLVEAFERYSSGSRPTALFSAAREACRSVSSARFLLSLSLSLSLKLHIFTVTKAVLAAFCRGCFLSFFGHGDLPDFSTAGSVMPCERLRKNQKIEI